MGNVQPWMRLKLNGDTYVLPDLDGTVYFRNNVGSFRMEGAAIQSWIQKLLPVFNGEESLANLTDGLPEAYQQRIYEIADILYDNGFVRDVSKDKEHQLSRDVLDYYDAQIEFVDSAIGSGAFHFQAFRNANILIVGAEDMLLSVVTAGLEAGAKKIHLVCSHTAPHTAPLFSQRMERIIAHYQGLTDGAELRNLSDQVAQPGFWDRVVAAMDAVVYVAEALDRDELHRLESICLKQNKLFVPGVFVQGIGIVGPVTGSCTDPESDGAVRTWVSAYRRMHPVVFDRNLHVSGVTETAKALIANVVVFELFNLLTGITDAPGKPQFYTLDCETLEGQWHEFIPAPDAEHQPGMVVDLRAKVLAVDSPPMDVGALLSFFADITNAVSGIFHVWDEGSLDQLPLSQCRVQPVDPLSPGPATLLPEVACAALTHEEARREAGLSGIEAYAKRLNQAAEPSITAVATTVGVGAGGSLAEAVGRGLQQVLLHQLHHSITSERPVLESIELGRVEDEQCAFCLNALRVVGVQPVMGRSIDRYGFPVAWVRVNRLLIGSVGYNLTMGLQRALAYAVLFGTGHAPDNPIANLVEHQWLVSLHLGHRVVGVEVGADDEQVLPLHSGTVVDLPAWDDFRGDDVAKAIERIQQLGDQVNLFDFATETFLSQGLAGVFGVSIQRGDKQ